MAVVLTGAATLVVLVVVAAAAIVKLQPALAALGLPAGAAVAPSGPLDGTWHVAVTRIVLPDAGHVPWLEVPGEFGSAVAEGLRRSSRWSQATTWKVARLASAA